MWPVVIECISNGRSQQAQGYNRYDHARDEYSNVGHSLPSPIARNDSGPTRKTSIYWIPGVSKIFKDGQSGTGDVTGSAKPSAGMK
jgi:hypothetical protein